MKYFGILIFSLLSVLSVEAGNVIDLSGNWQAQLHGNPSQYAVRLPGSLLTNHLGDDLSVNTRWTGSLYDSSFYYNPYMAPYRRKGHMKFPFFLTPNKHYVGEVVYTRAIFVPKAWKGRKVTLFLERPHIETTVTVNGKVVGHQMSLNTPHVYDVTSAIVPGKENAIVIKVYNGIENVCVGQDSHSVTDQTQGNWNGLVGRMELQCHGRHAVGNVQVYPHINNESATVVVSGTKEKLTFLLDGKSVDAKRQNDSTYLLAKVEVVASYKLAGINRTRMENLFHRLFAPARLNITINDRFGHPVQPEEWFLVPLFVIDEAVARIKDGSIIGYVYDPMSAKLVKA